MLIVEPLVGTRAEVAVTADSQDSAAVAEQEIVDEVARLESVFTIFDPSSELHAFRRSGTTDAAELLAVVELAERWRQRTAGAFHPGVQPLIDLWDLAATNGTAPSRQERLAVATKLRAGDGRPDLNLNAIAKGWIADRAIQATVDKAAVSAAWLSLGGDVVHRGHGSVVVGIEDPRRPYDNVAPLMTATLSEEALATSGGTRRWWTIGGDRYSKVLDPRSGSPVDRLLSATVIAADGATADVLATVALVLDPDETLALVNEVGADCLLVERDGNVTSSSDRFRPSQTR